MIHPPRILGKKSWRALLIAALLFLAPGATRAATDQVVNDCSNDAELHNDLAAIQAGGGGTLTFNCGAATIIVTSPLAAIEANTTIDGGDTITLSGNDTMRLLVVRPGATLTLNNITLSHANSLFSDGGAVTNLGTLNVNNSKFLNNATAAQWSGSAIYSEGPLNITNSDFGYNTGGGGVVKPRSAAAITSITATSFHDNESTASAGEGYGGAMQISDGPSVTISESTFTNNKAGKYGGAIYLTANSTLTMTTSLVNDNQASSPAGRGGGGLLVESGAIATVSNSTFQQNNGAESGGGILNVGTLTLTDTTIDNNQAGSGGGIYQSQGILTLNRVTISRNHAGSAGGLYANTGQATLTNVTISGNTATLGGAGLANAQSNTTLVNVTISDNSSPQGGGIFQTSNDASKLLILKNTILANASSENCFVKPGSLSGIVSFGFNLSSDLSCQSYFNQVSDQNNKDPHLGSLANNGGPTQTHMLPANSPAIDKGDACPSEDQRGVTRPQGPACDIGAVERQPNDGLFFLRLPLILR